MAVRMVRTLWAGLLLGSVAVPALVAAQSAPPASAPARNDPLPSAPPASIGAPTNGWGFRANDLEPDPAIRMGVLPNGMKYAVMRNATPKGGASMRMRFTVGWMYETPEERGLAHMIEHLALNETKNLPEGQLLKRLQLHGLQFGADTNAHTTFHETVYKLDIPNAAPNILDDSLFIMREVGGNALFNADTVNRERGIILSERQMRDTYQRKNIESMFRFLAPQTNLADGLKANDAVIEKAPPALIKALYDRYYRPERATLVVVGDFDPTEMETKIKAKFSDWKGSGPAGGEAKIGTFDFARASDIGYFEDPAVTEQVSLTTFKPYAGHADSSMERRQRILAQIGDMVMARRFSAIAAKPDAAILGGSSDTASPLFERAEQSGFTVIAKDGQLQAALGVADQEYRRAMQYGFTPAEVTEAMRNLETGYRTAAEQASTRRNTALAEAVLATHDTQRILTTPATNLARFEAMKASITAEQVTNVWKAPRIGTQPLYYLSGKKPLDTKRDIAAWLDASRKVALTAPVEGKAAAFAYTDFGAPGKIVEDKQIADLGIRTIRFANNVRLNLKKTDFEKGRVRYQMRVGSGLLALPVDKPGMNLFITSSFGEGGLQAHSSDDLQSVLAGRHVGRGLAVGSDAFTTSGLTIPADLGLQMQMLAAQLKAPGYRKEAEAKWMGILPIMDASLKATATGPVARDLARLAANGDTRFGIPNAELLAERNFAEARPFLDKELSKGAIEIALVGDFDEAAAIKAVADSVGALPMREAAPPLHADERKLQFATNRAPVRLTHTGTADQGMAIALWAGPDGSDDARSMKVNLLAAVAQIMMQDEIRERLGATYSPNMGASLSTIFPGYGYFSAAAPAAPDKMKLVFDAFGEVTRDLATKPVPQELLDRARIPMMEKLVKADNENAAWMGIVDQAQSRPSDLDAWRKRVAYLKGVTAADLQALAKQYLSAEPLRIEVVSDKAAVK